MSNSTIASHLLVTYGPRLSVDELTRVLRVSKSKIYHGVPGLKTYRDGRGRYADYRDVAAYLEARREEASA